MARSKSNIWAPIILVLLVVGGCGALIDAITGGDDKAQAAPTTGPIQVPDLVKTTLVDAENKTEALGLELSASGIDDIDVCLERTECVIYRMSPKPGTVVKAGAEIAVRYATGEELAFYRKHQKMPKVVGWSDDKADRFFEPISDVVDDFDLRKSSRVPVGKYQVIAQSPKPGRPLRIGQKIKLVIGYNNSSPSGTGDLPNGDGNVNVPGDGRESRFCSGRWWC